MSNLELSKIFFMRKLFFLPIIFFAACNQNSGSTSETNVDTTAAKSQIHALMDSMHNALSDKDTKKMVSFFTDDGLYLGTDPGEYWDKKKLSAQADSASKDTASFAHNVTRRDIIFDDDGRSAIVIEQYIFPMISMKMMIRSIARVDKKSDHWMIDFFSWNFIPKNEDVPKLEKALQ